MSKAPSGFSPCSLGRGQDGNAPDFFAKTAGYGFNDMIALPTLTKDSILDNLHRRFKVRGDLLPWARARGCAPWLPCARVA